MMHKISEPNKIVILEVSVVRSMESGLPDSREGTTLIVPIEERAGTTTGQTDPGTGMKKGMILCLVFCTRK